MNDENTDWQLECTVISSRGAHILKTGEFSDCTFWVGSGQKKVKFRAHKIILAMASPVFRAMFYGSLPEDDSVISITDIEINVFKLLLTYIYTDKINIKTIGEAMQLYYAAEKYILPHLVKQCVATLSLNLCANNVLVVYEFAVFNELQDLMDKSTKVIREHAKEVLKSSSFTEASLETVCMMFSMDPLNIVSELDLLAAAERYLEANKECADALKIDESMNMDDTAPSVTNESSTTLNTQLGDDKAWTKAKFTVNIARGIQQDVRSSPYFVRNLPWTCIVGPVKKLVNNLHPYNYNQYEQTLGIFIECNAESASTCWSCYATYSVSVICHKPNSKPICFKGQALFHSGEKKWGFPNIINWNEVLDPKNEYIKDGSITVEVYEYISAEAPHGVLRKSAKAKNTSGVDPRDKLTIKNALRLIRFLTLTAQQFADGAANSRLLYGSEKNAIFVNLISTKPTVEMPPGFCRSNKKRLK